MRARDRRPVSERRPREPRLVSPKRGPVPLAEALEVLAARLLASTPEQPRLQSRPKGDPHGDAI
jgi:hypothetical protein